MLHAFFKQLAVGGSIYAGRTLWLKAESLSLSNGQDVNSWANSGSAAGSFAPSGPAPEYRTNVANGKPAVAFETTSALLSSLTVGQIFGAQRWTWVVAAVGEGDQGSASPGVPFINSLGSDFLNIGVRTRGIVPHVNGTEYLLNIYTANVAFVAGHANAASGSHKYMSGTIGENFAANLPSLASVASSGLRIGINQSSQQFVTDMFILEMMVFNRFKTEAELASIAAQLRTKYAIS